MVVLIENEKPSMPKTRYYGRFISHIYLEHHTTFYSDRSISDSTGLLAAPGLETRRDTRKNRPREIEQRG